MFKKIGSFIEILFVVTIIVTIASNAVVTVSMDDTQQEFWWIRRRSPTPTVKVLTPTLVPSLTPTPTVKVLTPTLVPSLTPTPTITPSATPAYSGTPMPGMAMRCWLLIEVDGEKRPIQEFQCPSSIWYYNPQYEQPSTTIILPSSATPSR